MTMQQVEYGGVRRAYRPDPVRQRSGTYHRVHDELLKMADKDGVIQTTDACKAVMATVGVGRSSASSTIFQWSDPTGRPGYRRVRLYSPRVSAAEPNEMPDDKPVVNDRSAKHSGQRPVGFVPLPSANKNGPFYEGQFGPRKWGKGYRRVLMVEQTIRLQNERWGGKAFNLRDMAEAMADLGFNPTSFYFMIRDGVSSGHVKKVKPYKRFIKAGYPDFLRKQMGLVYTASREEKEPEQVPGGVEEDGRNDTDHLQSTEANKERLKESIEQLNAPARVDPLSDPNSFKGPKTPKMIEEERTRPLPPRKWPHDEELRQKVEALVESTLSAPETIRAIDKLVGEAILASARRQLGVE